MELVQIETSVATVSKDETGIARIVYKADAEVTIAEARENMEATTQAVGGVRSPVFIDIRPLSKIDREARQFFAGDDAEKVNLATALLVDSAVSRVFGNFFIGLNRPAWPTQMFSDESEAMSWLESHID